MWIGAHADIVLHSGIARTDVKKERFKAYVLGFDGRIQQATSSSCTGTPTKWDLQSTLVYLQAWLFSASRSSTSQLAAQKTCIAASPLDMHDLASDEHIL